MNYQRLSFYFAVFFISAMVMALQIMQSRIFSVTSWYHLSFVVISIAMFGLTLGSLKVYRGDETVFRKNYSLIARKHTMAFAFFIVVGLLAQIFLPLVSDNILKTLINLPLVALAISSAYYHAGVAITVSLTRSPYPIGQIYGADLLGAGLGCLFALLVMESIDTPSGIIFVSCLSFLTALCFPVDRDISGQSFRLGDKFLPLKSTALTLSTLLLCVTLANISIDRPFLYTLFFKNQMLTQKNIDFDAWNSISRVIVLPELENVRPPLWGRSPITPEEYKASYKSLMIDGDASTPITKFDGDFSKLKYLEYDVTNVAYSLPNLRTGAIIGVGGGRDLLSARYFGLEKIWAMDVNPIQIKLLKGDPRFTAYSKLNNLSGVEILYQEARSWFRQNTEKLDVIQMSLIDTWASTGAGAFALSENGLYTVEAWEIFIKNLSDHGVFTVSRWSKDTNSEFVRTLSVAKAALFNLGVQDTKPHIAIIHSGLISTIVVSKSPLSAEQIAALRKTAQDKQFSVVMMPDQADAEGILGTINKAKTMEELYSLSAQQIMDFSPSTDMRPFFFNQARLTKPLDIINMALNSSVVDDVIANGQAKAVMNLYIIILFSFVVVVLVILLPLRKTLKDQRGGSYIYSGSIYFALIGLGFMLIEISFLQALGVFLGHPIFGLSIVLFSLILSAGVGSFLSDLFPLRTLKVQILWCMATCAYAFAVASYINHIFDAFAVSDLPVRIMVSVGMIFPAGILMGFGFPTGLSLTEKFDTRATSWFWGINGAAGIFGSTIGIALNIAIGIDKTLILGGLCYALLAFSFLGFNRTQIPRT